MQVNEKERKELQEIFDLVDRDHGGTISPDELFQLMKTIGVPATKESVNQMVQEIDADGNGVIDYSEFLTVMTKRRLASTSPGELRSAFEVFRNDVPKGHIQVRDLKRALTRYGNPTTQISSLDLNNVLISVGLPTEDDAIIDFNHYIDTMTV